MSGVHWADYRVASQRLAPHMKLVMEQLPEVL